MSGPSAAGETNGRTPAIVYSALVFSLLGFACAVPAVIGLILGLIARPRARQAGVGVGLATAAIWVGVGWLVFFLVLIVLAMLNS